MMHNTEYVTGLKCTLAIRTNHVCERPSVPLNKHIKNQNKQTNKQRSTAAVQMKVLVSKGS